MQSSKVSRTLVFPLIKVTEPKNTRINILEFHILKKLLFKCVIKLQRYSFIRYSAKKLALVHVLLSSNFDKLQLNTFAGFNLKHIDLCREGAISAPDARYSRREESCLHNVLFWDNNCQRQKLALVLKVYSNF